MLTQEKNFTVEEASKVLGLSKRTVERFIKDGELKYYRFGSRIVISESQINTFAEKRRIKLMLIFDNQFDNQTETEKQEFDKEAFLRSITE